MTPRPADRPSSPAFEGDAATPPDATAVPADGTVRQVSVYSSPEEILMMEALDPTAEDPQLQVRVLDAEEVRPLAVEVVGRPRAPSPRGQDDQEAGSW